MKLKFWKDWQKKVKQFNKITILLDADLKTSTVIT